MTDLEHFALAAHGLIEPVPQSLEELNRRLERYGFKLVPRDLVPDYNLAGLESLFYFSENDTVFMRLPEGRA